jgi:hypothetical protein
MIPQIYAERFAHVGHIDRRAKDITGLTTFTGLAIDRVGMRLGVQ